MKNDVVRVCWGDPDTVYYVDRNDETHELDLRDNSCGSDKEAYAFGIWDGCLICGNYDDDTCGLMHDEMITFYVWQHGWPKDNIIAPIEFDPDVSWEEIDDLPIHYEGEESENLCFPKSIMYRSYTDEDDDEYFDIRVDWQDGTKFENEGCDAYDIRNEYGFSEEVADSIIYDEGYDYGDGIWKVLDFDDRETYGDLFERLGSCHEFRGRILMETLYGENDYFGNTIGFVSVWDNSDITMKHFKMLADEWGNDVWKYYLVTETNEQDASRYGIFNMPTVRKYLQGKTAFRGTDNSEEKEERFNIHLGNQEQKRKGLENFRMARDKKNAEKLGNMPMAQYHNLIYAENRVIKEAADDEFSFTRLRIMPYEERLKYCQEHLGQPIGEGSSRVVFQISDEWVLKLAMNKAGAAQNEEEMKYDVEDKKYYNFFPKVNENLSDTSDYYFIVTEYVIPIKEDDIPVCVGIRDFDSDKLDAFIETLASNYDDGAFEQMDWYELEEYTERSPFLRALKDYMLEYEFDGWGDWIGGLSNTGMAMRNGKPCIVFLDSGFSYGIFQKFYNSGDKGAWDDENEFMWLDDEVKKMESLNQQDLVAELLRMFPRFLKMSRWDWRYSRYLQVEFGDYAKEKGMLDCILSQFSPDVYEAFIQWLIKAFKGQFMYEIRMIARFLGCEELCESKEQKQFKIILEKISKNYNPNKIIE